MAEDPRAENCRAVTVGGDGKVTGVELVYRPMEETAYRLVRVDLIDEASAGGNTVASFAVLDKNGVQVAERVWLAWAWPDLTAGKLLPGNPNNQHMITNGYSPPELGPLGMYVGDAAGNVQSDVIGGLGLPWNRHVSFRMTWQERGAEPPEPPDPGDGVYSAVLERIAVAVERIAARLG